MKRKGSWVPYALVGGKLAYNAYKRFKANNGGRGRDYKRTRMAFRGGSAPVTNQFDVRTQYVGKRQSRQRRRRQKKFKKFSERVKQSDAALVVQTFIYNYWASATADAQAYHGFLLGGPNGTAGLNDDLRILFNLDSGITNPQSRQLNFKSMYMDIEVVNTSEVTVILDAYYVTCRRDVSNNDYGNLQQAFTQAFAELGSIGTGAIIDPSTPGVSPFDGPNFCEKFFITKKQRLIMSAGQVSSFVVKDTKKRKIESTDSNEYTLLRGQKGILFVFSAAVTNTLDIPASEMTFSVNRSYHYYHLSNNVEAGAQHP